MQTLRKRIFIYFSDDSSESKEIEAKISHTPNYIQVISVAEGPRNKEALDLIAKEQLEAPVTDGVLQSCFLVSVDDPAIYDRDQADAVIAMARISS